MSDKVLRGYTSPCGNHLFPSAGAPKSCPYCPAINAYNVEEIQKRKKGTRGRKTVKATAQTNDGRGKRRRNGQKVRQVYGIEQVSGLGYK